MLFNSSSLPKTILFFRLHCFKWIFHASQHEVCKQFIEQTYIRNRPEIRHGLCCTCFRQHPEKRNLPGRWDISTCEHLGHYVQQGVQKIIRRMFQKFCNKAQIIASPADLKRTASGSHPAASTWDTCWILRCKCTASGSQVTFWYLFGQKKMKFFTLGFILQIYCKQVPLDIKVIFSIFLNIKVFFWIFLAAPTIYFTYSDFLIFSLT